MHTPAMWHLLRVLCDWAVRAARLSRAALISAQVSALAFAVRTQRAWMLWRSRAAAFASRFASRVRAALRILFP